MGKGFITVKVFTNKGTLPLNNSKIIISKVSDGETVFEKTVYSDINGSSEKIEVETPAFELSQTPQSVIPYEVYDVIATKEDYIDTVIQGVQVFPNVTAIQKIDMIKKPKDDSNIKKNIIQIPPHGLVLDASRDKQVGAFSDYSNYEILETYVPKYITVHLGNPGTYAENITLPFTDYIKNVASSEIYPTWPEKAIRSNILTQTSFALNRIYTNWYNGKNYNFQITDSIQYDQYFIKGRNIYSNIEKIVDIIFNEYISKIGDEGPIFAKTCNDNDKNCKGFSQWGSVNLSEKGYDSIDILKYYYGDDIEIKKAVIIKGIPGFYSSNELKLGDKGDSVKIVQKELNKISQNYKNIKGILPSDGEFKESTESAVKEFQKIFELEETGVVDRLTWYKIASAYNGIKDFENNGLQQNVLEEYKCKYPGYDLKFSATGPDVKKLQNYLNVISNFIDGIPILRIDGIFSKSTEDAVIKFQKIFNLEANGIVTKETWGKLCEIYKEIKCEIINCNDLNTRYPLYAMKYGDESQNVKTVQSYINDISNVYTDIKKVEYDGVYGKQTVSSVKELQRSFSLLDDGIVGKTTWDKIYEIHEKLEGNKALNMPHNIYEYPERIIKFKDSDGYVKILQLYINSIASYIKNIKIKEIKIDGVFDIETLKAVKILQNYFKLAENDFVDKDLWNKIKEQYILAWKGEDKKNKELDKKEKKKRKHDREGKKRRHK